MPAANRVKKDHLLKLRSKAQHSEAISKKQQSKIASKKPAAITKSFRERKRQLEDSFAKINAELISQSRLPHNARPSGYNIFMDILKIRQVIELDDEEHTHQFGRSENEPTEQRKKRGKRQHDFGGMGGPNEAEEIVVIEQKSSARNETILQKKMSKGGLTPKQFANGMDSSILLADDCETELVDIDLRLLVDQQLCPPSTSVPVRHVQPSDCKQSPFISRARFDARAPVIDLRKRYELEGLRYFQDIPGQDLRSGGTDATSKCEKMALKIVSFNVLCQRSMDKMPHLYRHLRRNLSWDQRMKNLKIEFDRLDADVLCLQEVQDTHLQHLVDFFTPHRYQMLFTPRNGVDMPDGCAIFWRSDKLELIKSNSVYYNLGVHGMHKDNVGQVLAFSIVGTRSVICISNTHIYFNMKYGQIKLAQMAYLLCSMHQMESQICANSSTVFHFVGHILCGDFNMNPATPLHKFIIERSVDLRQDPMEMARIGPPPFKRQTFPFSLQLPVYRMRISSKCTFVDKENVSDLLDLKTAAKLTHSFTFASVYEHWNESGEPEVSIYHNFEAEAPDFIFYSVAEQRDIFGSEFKQQQRQTKGEHTTDKPLAYESFIRLTKRLSMPTRAQLDCACGPLPNDEHGSDHLCKFRLFVEFLVVTSMTICLAPFIPTNLSINGLL